MRLLSQPPQKDNEGPNAYLLRLARRNEVGFDDVFRLMKSGLVQVFPEHSPQTRLEGGACASPFLQRWTRYCPNCLRASDFWHKSWELLYADACAQCGHWLVDTCDGCDQRIPCNRLQLNACDCGHVLSRSTSPLAPAAVTQLARALYARSVGDKGGHIGVLNELQLHECTKVVQLLGAYASDSGVRRPQKVAEASRLTVSWPLTCAAAEILKDWPASYHEFLALKCEGGSNGAGRLSETFGGFYHAIYRGFKGAKFSFLRIEFENFVRLHWMGPIARRNRRFGESASQSAQWIPAAQAAVQMGVSRRSLKRMLDDGKISGKSWRSPTSRNFMVVSQTDVTHAKSTPDTQIPLNLAAERLGVKRQRLARLLPTICPAASKPISKGAQWAIPKEWVTQWEQFLSLQQSGDDAAPGVVTLHHVLSYWPWSDIQIASMLIAILKGSLSTHGKSAAFGGVGSLLLMDADLRQWRVNHEHFPDSAFSLPEAAKLLQTKQEVIYALARSGLLHVVERKTGRRRQQIVTTSSLSMFKEQFIFGSELASTIGRSPRATASLLAAGGVLPVAGPTVDGNRQVVFERESATRLLRGHI